MCAGCSVLRDHAVRRRSHRRAVGNTRRARDASGCRCDAPPTRPGATTTRLYGCRGVSCFGLHAGAFATELFAGVAPQSRDDVLLDATLTLSTGGLAKAGRSSDDLRALARQFHRDESGAVKIFPEPGTRTFENKLPGRLDEELSLADDLGVSPMSPDNPGFADVAGAGSIKWVVTADGELLVVPKHVGSQEISHAVFSRGRPVIAAGEADIAASGGEFFGIEIKPHSGHFRPDESSLQYGREAFESIGITFP